MDKVVVLPCEYIFHEKCFLHQSSDLLQIEPHSTSSTLEESGFRLFVGGRGNPEVTSPWTCFKTTVAAGAMYRPLQKPRLADGRIGTRYGLCQVPGYSIEKISHLWKDMRGETIAKINSYWICKAGSKMKNVLRKVRKYRKKHF